MTHTGNRTTDSAAAVQLGINLAQDLKRHLTPKWRKYEAAIKARPLAGGLDAAEIVSIRDKVFGRQEGDLWGASYDVLWLDEHRVEQWRLADACRRLVDIFSKTALGD